MDNKYIKRIVFAISLIMSIILMIMMVNAKILPYIYMISIGIVLFIMLIGEYFLIFTRKPKSKRSLITQILSLILSCVMIVGSFAFYKATQAVDLMTSQSFMQRAISVVVLKDSVIKNQLQIPKHQLGYLNSIDEETMNYAIDKIGDDLGDIDVKGIKDPSSLVQDLYNEDVDAIILDEAFRSLIEQDHKNFSEETRVVYQVTQDQKMVIAKDVDVTKKPFLVYISGNDEYGDIKTVSRSDVNMLVTVNPNTKQILLLSIPRDTYYPLHRNGQYDKFTHAGIYGLQESIDTLEDMIQEDINYYVRMNFTSFINIVDALGGITVYSPHEFTTVKGNYHIHKGENNLNAKEALSFVRERKAFVDGDFERGRNQQRMIQAIVKKICSPAILTSFTKVIDTVSVSVEMNLTTEDINALVKMQLSSMPTWDIQTYQILGDTDELPCYSSGGLTASVVVPYESSLLQATDYINQMMNNQKIDIQKGE